ncbi:MAG: hypothetical protein JWM88_1835 [Verrucomicrobia bacterium]|nr:hypothetical protein [Verrucomicrobiota bacterium]
MKFLRTLAVIGCLAANLTRAGGEERNFWPVKVDQLDAAGHIRSWEAAGPLIFDHPAPENSRVGGVRPLYVRTWDANGMITEASAVYPIFIYRADSDRYRWSVFNLINRDGRKHGETIYRADRTESFDVWPFYFSRNTGSRESSYRALFPIGGTIKDRFTFDRLSWVIWPLYFRTEKQGATTTSVPWPFLRVTRGAEHGFALWPLFGWKDRPERFHRTFYLWPLGWNNTVQPPEDAPAGIAPTRQVGFLPFYTRDQSPGYINENYGWPFFGYTDRTVPYRYHETRYFWPFFVQGRGDGYYVNRWGPFYTHSVMKGTDKRWFMWPLVKRTHWADSRIDQTKTQFLWFLYFSIEQRSVTNPQAAPADRTHVWPFFSKWDNGAGRKQFQLLSPFDEFFPTNEEMRNSWTPLFALYRSDTSGPENRRWSALWSAVTWRRDGPEREFHLGPLFSLQSDAVQKRVAIGSGLFGWKRDPGAARSRLFMFDFPAKPRRLSTASP